MSNIHIVKNGIYFPKKQIENDQLEKALHLENGYIEKRTGITNRYYAINENIEDMAVEAVKTIFHSEKEKEDIGLIITATTSTDILMPGISNYVQKNLGFSPCICLDILAGCGGYINAFDIAKIYMDSRDIKKALIIGVDKLSEIIDKKDIGTAVVLSDGAGATLIEKEELSDNEKLYVSYMKAERAR